jgi:hypothetical protein
VAPPDATQAAEARQRRGPAHCVASPPQALDRIIALGWRVPLRRTILASVQQFGELAWRRAIVFNAPTKSFQSRARADDRRRNFVRRMMAAAAAPVPDRGNPRSQTDVRYD